MHVVTPTHVLRPAQLLSHLCPCSQGRSDPPALSVWEQNFMNIRARRRAAICGAHVDVVSLAGSQ